MSLRRVTRAGALLFCVLGVSVAGVLAQGGPPAVHLANISTRLPVGAGDNVLIAGFIVTGTQQKRILVRGL